MGDQLVAEGDVRKATSALLGSTVAGSLVALVLYGIYAATHTRYIASEPYTRLALRVKTVLWAVFALLTAYSALVFCDVVHWTTTLKRSPDDILHGWPVDWLLPLFAGFVALPVQAVLAVRAAAGIEERKSRKMFVFAMALWILVAFAASIATTVAGFTARDTASLKINPREHDIVTAVWLWSTTVVNLALTISLALTLSQRRTAYDETTTSRIKASISALMHTASITAVLAFAGALSVTVVVTEHAMCSLIDWAFWLPLPACYGISLYTTQPTRRPAEQPYRSAIPLPTNHHNTHLQTKEMPALPSDSVTVMVPPSYAAVTAGEASASSLVSPEKTASAHSTPNTSPTKKPSRSSALYDRIEPWERRASIDNPPVPMPLGYSPSLQAGSRRASSLDIPIRAPSRLRGSSISDVETVDESEKEYGTDGEVEEKQEKREAEEERERARTDSALRSSDGFEHH
ncbi:hypothetical protein OF846_000275 [Rhodotorula toruloides]|nr:hypothetical protein OF846_000275 [Rhodotorula toruloides]